MISKEKALVSALFQQWADLRTATYAHRLHCECGNCGKRRRIGGRLVLPYAGMPHVDMVRLKVEEE